MSELLAAAFLFSLFFFAQGRRRICFKPPETACHESSANLTPRHAESKYLWVESLGPCATGLAVKPQTPFHCDPGIFFEKQGPAFPATTLLSLVFGASKWRVNLRLFQRAAVREGR